MHDIKRRLDGKSGTPDIDTSTVITHLEEPAVWQPVDEEQRRSSDPWQCQDAIRELRRKAERSHAVRALASRPLDPAVALSHRMYGQKR
ncbi:hypothetical protein ABZT06_01530 [Streptomyces sp. NPDC005483]|uniref:hypothetical protein n=1 Tax=Streptomyces sp. NPDC005483 TaxID=3154882 RepID=UPI00339DE8BF